MTYQRGEKAPASGVYWCTVCKGPASFQEGQELPECINMCGRGRWQLVKRSDAPRADQVRRTEE
jgi:hypothetical protein